MAIKNNNTNIFYWNSSDNRDHTHQRIEWAIENGYLVCINISINDKLFNSIKINDIILSYEPKYHKISTFENGNDGLCMSCNHNQHDGLQAFTNAFTIIEQPIIITDYNMYKQYDNLLYRNWFSTKKHCSDIKACNLYFETYFKNEGKIYLFPISHSGKLRQYISTNKTNTFYNNHTDLIYYGNIRKGFDSFNDKYLNNLIINRKLF